MRRRRWFFSPVEKTWKRSFPRPRIGVCFLVVTQSNAAVRRDDRRSGRRRGQYTIDPDIRSEYERDYDRVLYNYYFLRLGEITQVSSGHGKVLRHNRLTHSLKVAQVGRRLVQYLLNDSKNQEGIKAAG